MLIEFVFLLLESNPNHQGNARTPIPGENDYVQQEFGPPQHGPVQPDGDGPDDGVEDLVRNVRPPSVFAARRLAVVENALFGDSSDDDPAPVDIQLPTLRNVVRNVVQRTSTGRGSAGASRLEPRDSSTERTVGGAGRGAGGGAGRGSGSDTGRGSGSGAHRDGGNVDDERGTDDREMLGNRGFLNTEGSAICHGARERALVALLELAANTDPVNGIVATFGHNRRTLWLTNNIETIFSANGPLCAFRPLTVQGLRRHIGKAEVLAKKIYSQDHSEDTTGAEQEDQPKWTDIFFDLFHATSTSERPSQRTARLRRGLRVMARSLTGAQAPLGYSGPGPAELRHETSPNIGPAAMRSRNIGEVVVERVVEGAAGSHDNEGAADARDVDGEDDVAQRRPVPRRPTAGPPRRQDGAQAGNGNTHSGEQLRTRTSYRNEHVRGFAATDNDPSTRFGRIEGGYDALRDCTQALHGWLDREPPQPPQPRRTQMDVVRNYMEVVGFLNNPNLSDVDRAFLSANALVLRQEGNGILDNNASNNTNNTPTRDHDYINSNTNA